MNTKTDDTCKRLQTLIRQSLTPLIPSDYLLLDLPYYSNIGDNLIWQGTEDFLKGLSCKCLGRHSCRTFKFRPLPKDCTILLLGGGNFGDIWRSHQEFRLRVIESYPDNHIIILPQTIYYESEATFEEDIKRLNRHQQLTVCVRDHHSAELLKQKGFQRQWLTLPDMAFCIDRDRLFAKKSDISKESLLLLREDKEVPKGRFIGNHTHTEIEVGDWPNLIETRRAARRYLRSHAAEESDAYFRTTFLAERIREGVQFVSQYKMVYSTRLHVAILRLLLGLPVKMMDNSYGKNLSFYNTWLKDDPLVNIPDEKEQEMLEMNIYAYQQKQKAKRRRKQIRILALLLTILSTVMASLFIFLSMK